MPDHKGKESQLKIVFSTLPKHAILVIFVPVAFYFHVAGYNGVPLIIVSALAILGGIAFLSKSIEEIASHIGPMWGGLLNATAANLTELIVSIVALKSGMHEMVRASLTGSILGNLLLALGVSILVGGLRHRTQYFSRSGASINVTMLWLVLIMMMVPTFVNYARPGGQTAEAAHHFSEMMSLCAAILLLLVYLLQLIYTVRAGKGKDKEHGAPPAADHGHEEAAWSLRSGVVVLLAAATLIGFVSDYFVDAIKYMLEIQKVQISELFVGVVLVALIGNAADGVVAVKAAHENKMELSFQIAMGAALQVALFIAPILVILSHFFGKPFALDFQFMEIMFIAAGVIISGSALNDGDCNWIEGVTFITVYVFFAVAFWFQ